MDITKEKNISSWRQHGYVIYPKAVTHFYVLRYLQWLIKGGTNTAYSTHHQLLWDIRMYEPIYKAFSEVLGDQALMVSLDPMESSKIQGRICLQTEITIHKSNMPLRINLCDLIIFDAERCQLDLDSDFESFWLPLTMIPANELDDVTLQERMRYWHAKPFRTYLSPLGCKLLGLESWEPSLP